MRLCFLAYSRTALRTNSDKVMSALAATAQKSKSLGKVKEAILPVNLDGRLRGGAFSIEFFGVE